MSWNPSAGYWTVEKFDSSSGSTSTTTYQAITGGYVTLLPETSFSTGYLSPWERVTNWPYSNGLSSLQSITGSFTVLSGRMVAGEQVTSYQGPVFSAGAWEFYTDYPTILSNGQYSGLAKESLILWSGSPSSIWSSYFSGGGTKATIELDVVSLVSLTGTYLISGFVTGQNNLTGLSAITGVYINHGIYIDNNTYWDYLEISPQGLRSLNHPEIALPIDFTQPRKIRIAIDNTNLLVSADNGDSIIGIGKLDTATTDISPTTAKIVIGAPPLSGYSIDFNTRGIKGIVGNSLWDNIKILTGQAVIHNPTGNYQYYSTVPSTLYTDVFDPKIYLESYNACILDFIPYKQGSTTVVFQTSGQTGWEDGPSINLALVDTPYTLDISSVSTKSYGYITGSRLSNYSRLKITQQSNGVSPPPPLEEATLICTPATQTTLDIYPNWKPINQSSKILLGIDSSKFVYERPRQELWSTLLINSPLTTGSNSGVYDEVNSLFLSGTCETVIGGNYGTYVKNYIRIPAYAVTGSDAEDYFGLNVPVYNIFPNQYLSEYFSPVNSLSNCVTGRSVGDIAAHCFIPANYTGKNIVNYIKQPVYRPIKQAEYNRYNLISGNSSNSLNEYGQRLFIPANTSNGTYDGTEGIEFRIPSGIATDNVLVTVYTQITEGTGLYVYTSGTSSAVSFTVDKYTSDFFPLSFRVQGSNSGEIKIGLVVPSGTSTQYTQDFTIDNILCTPFTQSYLQNTAHSGYYYHNNSGLVAGQTSYGSTKIPRYLDTVFSTDLYLEAYPTGQGVIFEKLVNSSSKGFSFKVDSRGRPVLEYDLEATTRLTASGSSTFTTETYPKYYLTGETQIPLGTFVNIGFINQTETYNNLGWADYPSSPIPYNFASCNRAFIVMNGLVIGSKDNMFSWNRHITGECAPYVSYIPEGTGTVRLMSGLFGGFDAMSLKNDVGTEAEVELSIKGNKNLPYFVPDKYSKPNLGFNNYLNNTGDYSVLGEDLKLISIYNFYSNGYYCWDHGPIKNHLILYGDFIQEVTGGPYSDLGYIYFSGDSFAKAPYSSSFDRLFNTTGNIGLSGSTLLTGLFNNGYIKLQGWVKPDSSGDFFHIVEDVSNPSNAYFSIGINSGSNPVATRKNSNGNTSWSYTGSLSFTSGQWSWFSSVIHLGNYSGLGQSGTRFFSIADISGSIDTASLATGQNYGFQYYGRSGTTKESAILFGYSSSVSLCDISLSYCSLASTGIPSSVTITGSKGGRYNSVIVNQELFTGITYWTNLQSGELYMDKDNQPRDEFIYVAGHNAYDNVPSLGGGFLLFDDELFRHVQAYSIGYNTEIIKKNLGGTDSPIQLGYTVPTHGVNLAKLSIPKHNVNTSISSIDLSDRNRSNILGYTSINSIRRNGGSVSGSSVSGSFEGINTALYTGRADVVFSGQSYSKDIRITSLSIADTELTSDNNEAFYAYLIGRANYGVYVENAHPHISGVTSNTTGSSLANYFLNSEKLRNSIRITNSKGIEIPYEQYPFDVISSPFNPNNLHDAVVSGLDLMADGVGVSEYTGYLPTNVFTTLLLVREIPEQTYWVTYPSYRYADGNLEVARSEIINPIPVQIEADYYSTPIAGSFSIQINPNTYQEYSITINGIDGAYSGYV